MTDIDTYVPAPGDRVARLRCSLGVSSTEHVEYDTVDRVLKRDVVLASGERFAKPRLSKRGGGPFGWRIDLLPADHPRVLEAEKRAEEERQRRTTRRFLDAALEAVRGSDPGWRDEVLQVLEGIETTLNVSTEDSDD